MLDTTMLRPSRGATFELLVLKACRTSTAPYIRRVLWRTVRWGVFIKAGGVLHTRHVLKSQSSERNYLFIFLSTTAGLSTVRTRVVVHMCAIHIVRPSLVVSMQ